MSLKFGIRLKLREERRIIKKTISIIFQQKQKATENIAQLKLKLIKEHHFKIVFVNELHSWLTKRVKKKIPTIKGRLIRKFQNLWKEKLENEEMIKLANERLQATYKSGRRTVFNNSSRNLDEEQMQLLSLGLNFALTPKKFPIIEYIQAAEKLCQSLEEGNEEESIEKAKSIRHLMVEEIRKGFKMTIRSNLSAKERAILRELREDKSIIICMPALQRKGKQ